MLRRDLPGKTWLLLLAFSVGAASMAVEIVASRLLAPYFGASLFVWTSLILTILVALAVGYWFGGVAAERGAGRVFLGALLCASAALLSAGVLISRGFSSSLLSAIAAWPDASLGLFVGSLAAAIAVFAPPVVLLGLAGPILVKGLASGRDTGKASGLYLAWSTAGSVAGTLLPTLVLVPYLGSRTSFSLIAAFLLVLGVATLVGGKGAASALVVAPFMILSAGLGTPTPSPAVLAERESPYQFTRVSEAGGWRYLTFNEGMGVQSVLPPDGQPTGMYYDYFGLLPLLRPGLRSTAIIGFAAGTAAKQLTALLPPGDPKPRIVGVEIDQTVLDLARLYFGADGLGADLVCQDGRAFLATTEDRFDAIIVDAYSTQLYIPPHLVTREFFAQAKSRLEPDGILAINVNASGPDSPLFQGIANAVAANFRRLSVIPVSGYWNYVLLASDGGIDLAGAMDRLPAGSDRIKGDLLSAFDHQAGARPLFTDDWNPVEYLTDSMVVAEALRTRHF